MRGVGGCSVTFHVYAVVLLAAERDRDAADERVAIALEGADPSLVEIRVYYGDRCVLREKPERSAV